MDSAFSILGFLIFGLSFSISAILVESKVPSSLALLFASYTASPPPPPPPPVSPPPPKTSPPPPHHPWPPLSLKDVYHHQGGHHPPPPPTAHQMNAGQKVGLLFAGIAAIMQIGVIGFLVFKRRQLLKMDIYELGT